jgi:hypothetical protein
LTMLESSFAIVICLQYRSVGRVFIARSGGMHNVHLLPIVTKMAKLKVDKLTQTAFNCSLLCVALQGEACLNNVWRSKFV